MMTICGAAALFAAGMLILILAIVFLKGVASLNLHFISFSENDTGMGFGTGIANAIAGTILLAITSTILAIPFGVGTAIYLQKYAPDNQFTRFLRLMIEVLSGTPSIVLGIVALFLLVVYLKPITGGESLFAGAIALGALILPVIVRATEEAISRVPNELEEGSYALGATKWQTIRNILIPSALSGIIVGAILGFGRAAEESAVVLLTAGYSQYMPEFKVVLNPQFLLGIKIYPLNNLVGTLPVFLYTSYENSNVYPVSSIFAAGFVLVVIVMAVNLSAKAILYYTTATTQGHRDTGLPPVLNTIAGYLRRTDTGKTRTCKEALGDDGISGHESPRDVPEMPDTVPGSIITDASVGDHLSEIPGKNSPSTPKWKFRSPVEGIRSWLRSIRRNQFESSASPQQKPPVPRKEKSKRRITLRDFVRPFLFTLVPFIIVAAMLLVLAAVIPALSPAGSGGVLDFFKAIVIAIIICAICAIIALFLLRRSAQILRLRKKNPLLGNRTGAFVAVIIGICMVLIGAFLLSAHLFVPPVTTVAAAQVAGTTSAGVINTPYFSFNLQPQDLITLQNMNNPVFSFDLQDGDLQVRFVNQTITSLNMSIPATGSTGSVPVTGAGTTTDKSARLAAFLAQQNGGEEGTTPATQTGTPAPAITPTPVTVSAAPAQTPAVPVKFALDVGESYWYGDNSRPCLATVSNVTVLPFYFWWDMDWNRFVQQTPATNGDVFLVTYIRIEDTGNMSAIVPSADQFIVTYNGQTYTHNVYFDTSILSANEINYYTTNYNALPYQWIREIGQQKRDYAFLTGYNVFGQNQTVISNFTDTANAPPTPPDTNGQGYFIMPGRSNAIDGYLIYEVPGTVAADLRDAYLQTAFNSFSPTRWRLGK